MQLKGKRILIEKPVRPDNGVILTEDVQTALDAEFMKSWSKLKVVAVGDEVTAVKAGDSVYIGSALANCEVIDINQTIYFIANELNVAIIWGEED